MLDELRPYQREAVTALTAGLAAGGLGQLHAACGSGKTQMAVQAAVNGLVPDDGLVVVLAPSIPLVAQLLTPFRAAFPRARALAVCSDATVGRGTDTPMQVSDLDVPVTTDAAEIAAWCEAGSVLLVGTYASADRVAEALHSCGRTADLLVCDEAHRLAGRPDAQTKRVTQPGFLPARRALFMTATPRMDAYLADRAGALSMDDRTVFGPVLYRYPFPRAIAERWLSDYRILVMGVPHSDARAVLETRDAIYHDRHLDAQTLAAQIALIRAREKYGISRALTFHSRVKGAQLFAGTLADTFTRVPGVGGPPPAAHHVSGVMSHQARAERLTALANTPQGAWTVISNARCLTEGVDVPAVDAVLFANPKDSAVDIVQAVGRALRRHGGDDEPATIIVPVVVPEDAGEVGDLDPRECGTLWRVIRALRAHDETLGIELDMRRGLLPLSEADLPDKIVIDMPDGVAASLLTSLATVAVRQTTSPWWEGYAEASEYYTENGNLDVPFDHVTARGHRLGQWIQNTRQAKKRGWLPEDRITALAKIGMIWDMEAYRLEVFLRHAHAYRQEFGNLLVPQVYRVGDYRLGTQVNVYRRAYATGRLTPEQIAACEEAGMVWNTLDHKEQTFLQHARAYHKQFGNLLVHRDYVTPSGYPLGTALRSRCNRYRRGELRGTTVTELEKLGVVWSPAQAAWEEGLAAAARYVERHGDLEVPVTHTDPEGYNLGDFIAYYRALAAGTVRDKQGTPRPLPVS
ncbi:DEAD/DEAH box helicase, partial [Streptomyces palmae]